MSEKEKQRLFLFGGIAIVILLFFLLRDRIGGVANTIIEQVTGVDSSAPPVAIPDISLNLPPLSYTPQSPGNFSYRGGNVQFGCALCGAIADNTILPAGKPAEIKQTPDEPKKQIPPSSYRAIIGGGGFM